MKNLRLYIIALFISMIALSISASDKSEASKLAPLTVEKIMRDRLWMAHWPSAVFWSEDNKNIYFNWNPENADADSLYVFNIKSDQPEKLSLEERLALPSKYGDYNKDYSKKVYTQNGDIFILDLKKGTSSQITNTLDKESNVSFTHDGNKIIYKKDGNLYCFGLKDGCVNQLTDFRSGSKESDNKDSSSDHEKWLKDQQMSLFETLRVKKEKEEKSEEAEEKEDPKRPLEIYRKNKKVYSQQLSPDERFVTFLLENEPSQMPSTIVPKYVTETGFTVDLPARTKVGCPGTTYEFGIYDIINDSVFYVSCEGIPGIYEQPEYLSEYLTAEDSTVIDSTTESSTTEELGPREVAIRGPFWSDDGTKAFVVILSLDNKDRWIMSLNPEDGNLSLIDRQTDTAWIGGPGIGGWHYQGDVGWLADNETVWFQSEETGYSHLYTVNINTGYKKQLTSGNFEVRNIQMSRDKKHWYFISNEIHPGEQQFYRMKIKGGKRVQITNISGGNSVYMSPDEKTLAILHSTTNRPPEIYIMANKPNAKAKQITHSLTDEYLSYSWREPEIVTFNASDSATVYARLFKPDNLKPGAPAVMFVHGAGYTQNAHKRWSWYYREYMFHNLLVDNGYVVLDIDYRGSAGYGRDWRTGIYRHMGGKDLDDYVDGAKYLVNEFGVDSSSIGIYGGSYGGFLTLMAMFTQPDIFKAGAGLRSVADWAHYNHGYTSNILNVPHLDSIAYAQSSPINFAEGLKGHLLLCHGMIDRNVHFQDIMRLSQRLIELGKDNWEVATYPLEAHSFKDACNWTDEYKRIFKLFEETLK